MTGYKRVNYYELCRLCTSSQPKDKVHIFREEGRKMQLQQKIQSCFPLLVCEHDYLPKVVCTTCIQTLDQCYSFRQSCLNSETMLSSYFSNFRFTDDFKKAGKVYVKDTGQKLENVIQNVGLGKKVAQDNMPANLQQNVMQDGNQQYFTLELPVVPNKNIQNYTKLSLPNVVQNQNNNSKPLNEFTNLNQNPNILNTPKPIIEQQLKYNLKSQDNQNNLVQCNLTSLNFNGNLITNKNGYEQKLNNNIDPNSEFNIMKANVMQPMMLIDVEQLIESGLPESEVNKLKEVFLKPVEYNKTKPQPITQKAVNTDDTNHVLHNLNNQLKSELNNTSKNFKCEICDKSFRRREHLYQHSKLHSGLRPFNCIHCPKTFSRKEHLMRHLTSHSGVKDYGCDICTKKFSRPDNLKKHKKTHQKSGPFICEVCQKSFVIKHYYLAHKLQHHDNDPVISNMLKAEGNDI